MGNTDGTYHPNSGADNLREEFSAAPLEKQYTVLEAGGSLECQATFGAPTIHAHPVTIREAGPLPLNTQPPSTYCYSQGSVLTLSLGLYILLELSLMEECFSSNMKILDSSNMKIFSLDSLFSENSI